MSQNRQGGATPLWTLGATLTLVATLAPPGEVAQVAGFGSLSFIAFGVRRVGGSPYSDQVTLGVALLALEGIARLLGAPLDLALLLGLAAHGAFLQGLHHLRTPLHPRRLLPFALVALALPLSSGGGPAPHFAGLYAVLTLGLLWRSAARIGAHGAAIGPWSGLLGAIALALGALWMATPVGPPLRILGALGMALSTWGVHHDRSTLEGALGAAGLRLAGPGGRAEDAPSSRRVGRRSERAVDSGR